MKKFFTFLLTLLFLNPAQAGSEHEGHDDHDEHEQHEESSSSAVGPEKGITDYDEHKGFKLSLQATQNFEIRSVTLMGAGPWELPSSAVLFSGEERNVYRLRDGFYKRLDFQWLSNDGAKIKMKSEDLKPGDQIVIHGLGFLRMAELAASGNAPSGHSH